MVKHSGHLIYIYTMWFSDNLSTPHKFQQTISWNSCDADLSIISIILDAKWPNLLYTCFKSPKSYMYIAPCPSMTKGALHTWSSFLTIIDNVYIPDVLVKIVLLAWNGYKTKLCLFSNIQTARKKYTMQH